MQLKTILKRVQKFKYFVFGGVYWVEGASPPTVEVELHARRNSRPACSECGHKRPGYDRLTMRRFEFIPMWGIKVFSLYAPRRVDCPDCGVRVERIPWAAGKHRLTESYAWFLAGWARRMSWQEVAVAFRTSWDHVFHSVEMAVSWGRAHQNLTGIKAIGVDEIQWQRGHKYLTLVYQVDADCKRLLWIGSSRKAKTMLGFFRWFGQERTQELSYVCSDMWKPYPKVIAKKAGHALNILDRFHIMAQLSKAIDEVRSQEAKALKDKGYDPVLTKTRWLLLKRAKNLTSNQETTLADLVQYNLRSIRSYLLKEELQLFWSYISPYWAGQFLDKWCTKTMRSRIEPMKKVARRLRKHRPLLLSWFRAKGQFSSGIAEGFNNKAKLTTRKAYGLRRTMQLKSLCIMHLGLYECRKQTHVFF